MAGLFDTFGISADDVEAVGGGGGIPAGTYPAKIQKAEVKKGTKKDEDAISFILYYEVDGYNYPAQEWIGLPKTPAPWDETVTGQNRGGYDVSEAATNRFKLGVLKKRLLSIGIPEDRVNSVSPDDLAGMEVVITLTTNKDNEKYTNVTDVSEKRESATALPVPTPAAAGFGGLFK